jgi:hypothetical protein
MMTGTCSQRVRTIRPAIMLPPATHVRARALGAREHESQLRRKRLLALQHSNRANLQPAVNDALRTTVTNECAAIRVLVRQADRGAAAAWVPRSDHRQGQPVLSDQYRRRVDIAGQRAGRRGLLRAVSVPDSRYEDLEATEGHVAADGELRAESNLHLTVAAVQHADRAIHREPTALGNAVLVRDGQAGAAGCSDDAGRVTDQGRVHEVVALADPVRAAVGRDDLELQRVRLMPRARAVGANQRDNAKAAIRSARETDWALTGEASCKRGLQASE